MRSNQNSHEHDPYKADSSHQHKIAQPFLYVFFAISFAESVLAGNWLNSKEIHTRYYHSQAQTQPAAYGPREESRRGPLQMRREIRFWQVPARENRRARAYLWRSRQEAAHRGYAFGLRANAARPRIPDNAGRAEPTGRSVCDAPRRSRVSRDLRYTCQ